MPSLHDHLEEKSVHELLVGINEEDKKVAVAVEKAIPQIEKLVEAIVPKMKRGGRIFYLGAGTSGRLGVLDASEIPPTYGMPNTYVIGLIAGGDTALRNPVEAAEDSAEKGWKELCDRNVGPLDTVIGIAASGTTPYVIGALHHCRKAGILTASISCNPGSPVSRDHRRTRVRDRKYTYEIGYGAKAGFKYDFYRHNDKNGSGERQPNGEYAIDQPETDRSGGSHDCGRNGLGL